jgi:phosphoglycolate phosphatase
VHGRAAFVNPLTPRPEPVIIEVVPIARSHAPAMRRRKKFTAMRIFLFDIDGTLIRSQGAGRQAIDVALQAVFGKVGSQAVEVNGRTDRGIARHLFQHHGIDDSPDNWHRFRTAYLDHLPDCLRNRTGTVLPGVAALLQALIARDDAAVGLLTGNVREGARIKLTHFALMNHFLFGGFGDDHVDRDDVAREAFAAAREHTGQAVCATRVWVIGDTPWDVRCARAIGARVVAVATGAFTVDELTRHKPDLLLDDLNDTRRLLEKLLA